MKIDVATGHWPVKGLPNGAGCPVSRPKEGRWSVAPSVFDAQFPQSTILECRYEDHRNQPVKDRDFRDSAPTGKRERPGAEVRAAIRYFATLSFAETGYPATTLRDIAAKANVTGAAVYYHYSSKEMILSEIIFDAMDKLTKELIYANENSDNSVECLNNVVESHISYILNYPNESKIIIEDSRFLSHDDYKKSNKMQTEILDIYMKILTDIGYSEDTIRIASFNIISVIVGIYRWYREYDETHRAAVMEMTKSFIQRAVTPVVRPAVDCH